MQIRYTTNIEPVPFCSPCTALGTFNGYDERNRLTVRIDTQGDKTSSGYDANGNVVRSTDAKNQSATALFDARGQRRSQTDRLGGVTTFKYDAGGNLLELCDADNQGPPQKPTIWTYDLRNQKLTEAYPGHDPASQVGDAGYDKKLFAYDLAGRASVFTDQQGDTVTFGYDLAGRMLKRDYRQAGQQAIADSDSFTFDDASRLLAAVSGRYNNTVAFQYGDGAGRRTSEALTVNLGQARTYRTTHRYDVVGRIVDINYPDQSLATRSYTDRNELAEVSWAGDWLARYTYESNGFRNTRAVADARGTSTGYTRYVNGTAIGNLIGSIQIGYGGGTEIYQYAYDANKNVTSEQITGPMAVYGMGVVSPGGFDAEDRLRAWLRNDGRRQDWTLSSTGDWSGFVDNGQLINYFGDASHQLTPAGNFWQYDPKGNLTLDAWNKQHHYAWDFDNRLKAADVDGQEGSEIAYTYDALGRRVSKSITTGLGTETPTTTTTVFVCRTEPLAHSPYAGQEVAEYAVDAATSDPLRKFVYGVYIDEPLVMIDRTAAGVLPAGEDERFYYHQNNNHNVIALTNQAGEVVERCSYTPYGQATFHDPATGAPLAPQPAASPLGNPFLYTGRRLDSETGLHYYRARQYSSAQGRFLGRDPIGYEGGMNLYEYVGGSPFIMADPDGQAKYKIGSDDPPVNIDAGAGAWGSEPPTFRNQFLKAMVGSSDFQLMVSYPAAGPNAARNWRHYFANNGQSLNIPVQTIIRDSPYVKARYDAEVEEAKAFVESLSTGTHKITSSEATVIPVPRNESADWFYAVGAFAAWGKGTATLTEAGGSKCYSLAFEYKLRDRYNWDPGKTTKHPFGINFEPISDDFMAQFHRQGIAKEYDMFGSYSRTYTWKK